MKTFLRILGFVLPFAVALKATAQTLPVPEHIVVLIEENYAYSEIIGSSASAYAPYINALCSDPHAAVFTQSYAIEHPSEPNYLDFFSGENQGTTGSDGIPAGYPFTTPNLAAQLIAASKTFKTYSEDLPAPGYDGATYTSGGANYARKHNPCTNWVGTGTNQYSGSVVNVPYVGYFPDLANYSTLPTISYVVPNMTNDMHDGTYPSNITIGDTWFHNHLASLLPWAMDNYTLFIIIFDEDDDLHGNNIPTIFYGPMVQGGTYARKITFCNILRTFEDMYGLGHAACAADSSNINWCWVSYPAGTQTVSATSTTVAATPNPSNLSVTFSSSANELDGADLVITDITGRVMAQKKISGNSLELSTELFPAGMYCYSIATESKSAIKGRFVVAHP